MKEPSKFIANNLIFVWWCGKLAVYLHYQTIKTKRDMSYQMKALSSYNVDMATLHDMYVTIMRYIKGDKNSVKVGGDGTTYITERLRQYWTWGATNFKYVCATDGCYGIEFKVRGMLHKGRVRIYYNVSSDYFDVELLRARKEELVWGCECIDFVQLHNVLHQHIERTDDVEV